MKFALAIALGLFCNSIMSVEGALLKFSHARQSRGVGYTGPSVHFALEAIDDNPLTYSCTQNSVNAWIELFFDTPSVLTWIKFELKPTTRLSLTDHTMEAYNGNKLLKSCHLEYQQRWQCGDPEVVATSVRISVMGQGKMEIASIEPHGTKLPIQEMEFKRVCHGEECIEQPLKWDLECKGLEMLEPPTSEDYYTWQQRALYFLSEDEMTLGTLFWNPGAAISLTDYNCGEIHYGPELEYWVQEGDTWSVMKNYTTLSFYNVSDYNTTTLTPSPLYQQSLLSTNDCYNAISMAGNSVDKLIFSETMGQFQFRTLVEDTRGTERFHKNDWMEVRRGAPHFLQLERHGLVVHTSGRTVEITLMTSDDGDPNKLIRLGKLTLLEDEILLDGCGELYYDHPIMEMNGTWIIEKNETHFRVAKEDKMLYDGGFESYGRECGLTYSGNVVHAFASDTEDQMCYKDQAKSPADEMRWIRACPTCPPDYGILERTGLEWKSQSGRPLDSFTLCMFDTRMREIANLTVSWNGLELSTQDGSCRFSERGYYSGSHFRVMKNETMICLLVDGRVVFEVDLREAGCLEGSIVRYVGFTEDHIVYRKYKTNVKKLLTESAEEAAGRCDLGYMATITNTGDVVCVECRRGSYGDGKECYYCSHGFSTLQSGTTASHDCLPKKMIECNDFGTCWLRNNTDNHDNNNDNNNNNNWNDTRHCDCLPDQYCRDGRCYYQDFISKGSLPLPSVLLLVAILCFLIQ